MSGSRDTHFLGFARLQMPELDSLFAVLYQAYASGDMARRDEYSKRIETYLARRAYDLLFFLIDKAPQDYSSFRAGYGTPSEIRETIEQLPDMTEFPPIE
jgi:hypothetical protein